MLWVAEEVGLGLDVGWGFGDHADGVEELGAEAGVGGHLQLGERGEEGAVAE